MFIGIYLLKILSKHKLIEWNIEEMKVWTNLQEFSTNQNTIFFSYFNIFFKRFSVTIFFIHLGSISPYFEYLEFSFIRLQKWMNKNSDTEPYRVYDIAEYFSRNEWCRWYLSLNNYVYVCFHIQATCYCMLYAVLAKDILVLWLCNNFMAYS